MHLMDPVLFLPYLSLTGWYSCAFLFSSPSLSQCVWCTSIGAPPIRQPTGHLGQVGPHTNNNTTQHTVEEVRQHTRQARGIRYDTINRVCPFLLHALLLWLFCLVSGVGCLARVHCGTLPPTQPTPANRPTTTHEGANKQTTTTKYTNTLTHV